MYAIQYVSMDRKTLIWHAKRVGNFIYIENYFKKGQTVGNDNGGERTDQQSIIQEEGEGGEMGGKVSCSGRKL